MARDIEFLAAPDPDGDDSGDDEPRPPRIHPLLWVVLAAMVAAAAVWIASRPTESEQQAAEPARTVTATPSPIRSSVTPRPSVEASRVCTAGGPINAQLRRIAERRLKTVTVLADQSFRCITRAGGRHLVASESMAVRHGAFVVEIQASRRVGDSGQYIPAPGGKGIIRLVGAESQSAGLNVTVEVFGRAGTTIDPLVYQNIASDVSLQVVL